MGEWLIKIIYNINYKPLMKDYLLMESSPDYSDNTRAVFEKLIELGVNKTIKVIWFVRDSSVYNNIRIKRFFFITVDF